MKTKAERIEQIRKLLALSNSPEKGEAEKAMALAMKFAASIGIDICDVEGAEEQETVQELKIEQSRKKIPYWEKVLISNIAAALGCVAVTRILGGVSEQFIVVGQHSDCQIVDYVFCFCKRQLRVLCSRDKQTYKNAGFFAGSSSESLMKRWEKQWYIGAAARVSETALQKFKQEASASEQEKYALVICDKKQKIKDYMDRQGKFSSSEDRTPEIDARIASIGYTSAAQVSLDKSICGQSNTLTGNRLLNDKTERNPLKLRRNK